MPARRRIGIVLVSGMIVGTPFTLFVVPSIFMLVARSRVRAEAPEAAPEPAPPALAPAAV